MAVPSPTSRALNQAKRHALRGPGAALITGFISLVFNISLPGVLLAQGVTTAAIRGHVAAADSTSVEGSKVSVANVATGYTIALAVRGDQFFVQGLDVITPYVLTVERIGYRSQQMRLSLTLGEVRDVRIVMQPDAISMDTLRISAGGSARRNAHGGAATVITDALIHGLPTPNGNVYDLVGLAPHVSTKVGLQRSGISALGANHRFNNFLIDGAEERFVNSNLSAAINIGKSIPLDAVRAYEVLIAPYDVRYGGFAGALINTVTASGTNELQGSTFASWRNDRLGRTAATYDRVQYGFSVGGPIIRDRVHFFIAPEFQRFTLPAAGSFVGQDSAAIATLSVSEADITRMTEIMSRRYNLQPGSAGFVELANPLHSLFARIDAAIPEWRSRASAFVTYSSAEEQQFSRTDLTTFALSSYKMTVANGLRTASLRVHTDLAGTAGGHNEVVVSQSSDWNNFVPDVRQPLIRVWAQRTDGPGRVTLLAGSSEQAHGRFGRASSIKIRDDLSLPLGEHHVVRLGLEAERLRIERGGVAGGYGVWTFGSLDAFEQGFAGAYEVRKEVGSASTTLRGGQYAVWIGDEWRVAEGVSLTFGARADWLNINGRAPYNAAVDSIFGRRTDLMPAARVHLSPRFGFTWDLSDGGADHVRGGAGVFTGRAPLAWFVPALSRYGVGIGELHCSQQATDDGPPPPFVADYRTPPTACAAGRSMTTDPDGDVDLLGRDLRMAQVLRSSLAYERALPWSLFATAEVIYSRHLSDFVFVNMNLRGPQSTDNNGRVLYGTIKDNGLAVPAERSEFAEVIDLKNTSKNYSWQFSARVEKQFTHGLAATASYTFSRVRDVQSLSRVNLTGTALWADARAISGRHEALSPSVSLNDVPHRIVAGLTYTAPWRAAATTLSFYYVGESGSPFTYLAYGLGKLGDLNADGSNANDPIYVPRNVFDENEIRFNGVSDSVAADNSMAVQAQRVQAQQVSFNQFIDRSSCLSQQRGQILERNQCREPGSHTTLASLRQMIGIFGREFEAGMDVFNVLNLLNKQWGRLRVSDPRLLEHVEQTDGVAGATQPIFRYQPRAEWRVVATESAYQLQFTLRYRF